MNSVRFGAIYSLDIRNTGKAQPDNIANAEDSAAYLAAEHRNDMLRLAGFREEGSIHDLPIDQRGYFNRQAKCIHNTRDGKYYLVDGPEWAYLKAMYRAAMATLPKVVQALEQDLGQRAAMFQTSVRGIETALVEAYKERNLLSGTMHVDYEVNPEVHPSEHNYLRVTTRI